MSFSESGLSSAGAFVPHGDVMRPGDDTKMFVKFYNRAVPNPRQSEMEGRPIYEKKAFVRIQQPGELLNITDRPVRDEDTVRFSRQWQAFQANQEQVPEGTSLDHIFPTNPEIVEHLRFNGVHTLEHLEALSEQGIMKIGMGARAWQDMARRYLENARTMAPLRQAEALNDELRNKVALLERQLAEVSRRLADDEDQPRRRRRMDQE